MSKKNEEKLSSLKAEYERIEQISGGINIPKYLTNHEEYLPDLGDIDIYNYDIDAAECSEKASDVVSSLVDLFLGDSEAIKNHPYIQNKMNEDAEIYAETLFLKRMTKKNLLTLMRQIDNGDNSSRMHEVVNNTFTQMRENIKFSTTQRTSLESFYKIMRKDLGMNDISESLETPEDESTENTKVMDNRAMNDMMEKYLKFGKSNGSGPML